MERRRLWIERVERLRSERVWEKLWLAWGEKIRSAVVGGGIGEVVVVCGLLVCECDAAIETIWFVIEVTWVGVVFLLDLFLQLPTQHHALLRQLIHCLRQ